MPKHLAIVLPGRGYGSLGAAIRVPVLALEERGASVRDVTYHGSPSGDDWPAIRDDVRQQIEAAVAASGCERITFVAKSLGTRVIAEIAPQLPPWPQIDAIWLTPLFGAPEVRDGAIRSGWPSLLVAGTADPLHDPAGFDEVARQAAAQVLVIDGADHSLERAAGVLATIDVWRSLAEATLGFIR